METTIYNVEDVYVEKKASGDRWLRFDDTKVILTREQACKLIAELAREEAISRNNPAPKP